MAWLCCCLSIINIVIVTQAQEFYIYASKASSDTFFFSIFVYFVGVTNSFSLSFHLCFSFSNKRLSFTSALRLLGQYFVIYIKRATWWVPSSSVSCGELVASHHMGPSRPASTKGSSQSSLFCSWYFKWHFIPTKGPWVRHVMRLFRKVLWTPKNCN